MIKCIVIDDEQPARELIATHLGNLPDFKLLASFDNALDGFNFLQKNTSTRKQRSAMKILWRMYVTLIKSA